MFIADLGQTRILDPDLGFFRWIFDHDGSLALCQRRARRHADGAVAEYPSGTAFMF